MISKTITLIALLLALAGDADAQFAMFQVNGILGVGAILAEDGSFILQEDGIGHICQEGGC